MHDRFDELFDDKKSKPIEEKCENRVFLKEFFEEVEALKHDFFKLELNVNKVNESIDQLILSNDNQQLHKNIDNLNFSIKRFADRLKTLKSGNNKIINKPELKIRINSLNLLTTKFRALIDKYNTIQKLYQKLLAQFKLVNPQISEDELYDHLENGDIDTYLQNSILVSQQKHSMTKETLSYIENKRRSISKLEHSIQDLHQLFLDLAILVDQQDDLINDIAYNVLTSVSQVRAGVQELKTTNRYQKNSRKKMFILVIILIILLIAIMVGVTLGLKL